ncbi:MAG: hypothetical protein C0598_10460 [Marinilabiliales bacterium]|nr:MAG: hypothetical protein C0598_10460 [Marinilabiliales bacterium]
MKIIRIFSLLIFMLPMSLIRAELINDSLEYSRKTEDFKKYLNLSKDEQFELDERKLFSSKAIKIADELDNPRMIMEAHSSDGYIDAQRGLYAHAFETFNYIKKISDSVGYNTQIDYRRKAYISNILGLMYKELGDYDKALTYYYNSLAISDSLNWLEASTACLNNISVLYNINGNTQQAISILKESWNKVKDKNHDNILFDVGINLFDMYVQINNHDSAYLYGSRVLDLAKKLDSPYNQAYVLLGFSKLYLAKKDYKAAIKSINNAIDISEEKGFGELKLESYLLLAEVYRKRGSLQKSKVYMNKAFETDTSLDILSLHIKYLFQLAKLRESEDNFKSAYIYYQKAIHLKDSVNKSWEKVKYSEIETLSQIKLQKQRNEVLEKDLSINKLRIKHQRLILIISAGSLIVLLLLVIILYRKRKYEKKTNELLREQNKKIKTQDKIIRIKNEESLKLELDYKNRQLTSFSLSALKLSKALDNVFQSLREILNTQNIKSGTRKNIEAIIQNFKPHSTENEWEEFRSYFEAVHPSFYKNLKKKAPNMTFNEQKICAYVRLGMTTKEIASITFRQIRSIESTRFRIRKKLGLTATDNLYDYLEKL